jgi:hypothetical protein
MFTYKQSSVEKQLLVFFGIKESHYPLSAPMNANL